MKALSIINLGIATLATTQACLLPRELEAERQFELTGHRPDHGYRPSRRQSSHVDYPVGTGDRFKAGTVVPRGLGTEDRSLGSILNTNEVNSALQALAKAYPDVKVFAAPHQTFEKRTVYGATIGKGKPRVFIQGGVHARERGSPDNVIYAISDLLQASKAGKGLKYGNKTFTSQQVKRALSAGVVILPLNNPDGVAYDAATNSCWRKNRNTTSSTPGKPRTVGIDINRNFDFLWEYLRYFSPKANLGSAASDDPASEIFHGLGPASEAETRNTVWVEDSNPSLSWYIDVHSYGGDVLYGWGIDDMQTTNPLMNFGNSTYDGKRGILGQDPPDSVYQEYIDPDNLAAGISVSARLAQSITSAGTVKYVSRQSVSLYPTSGGSGDYTQSRYLKVAPGTRIKSLTLEFGEPSASSACPFYPDDREYHNSIRQVSAGLIELLLSEGDSLCKRRQD